MIMYVLIALTLSITILGVHYLTESLLSNLLNITLDDVFNEFGLLSYPLIYCPTCMTSLWGIPLLALFPVQLDFYEYVITFFQIGFFNYAISKYL